MKKSLNTAPPFSTNEVFRSSRYRANPDNKYHHSYQKAVNRVFVTSLYLLSMCAIAVSSGWAVMLAAGVVLPFLMAGVAGLIVFFVEVLLPLIGEFIDWLGGH